jgi:uncharacterized protein DUF1707
MNAQLLSTQHDPIRASDADRDKALGLLRDHWLAGRLTLDEYEERCGEAARARVLDELRHAIRELPYPLPEHEPIAPRAPTQPPVTPPTPGSAFASVVLGALALLGLVGSFGLLFLLTLPASTWGWLLGRRARRGGAGEVRVLGTIGEVLGIVATLFGCLALSACAVIVSAV